MITQFQRRRNANPAFATQKLNYRIQVDGDLRTFKAKKVQTGTPSYSPSLDFSKSKNSMYIPIFPL